jgi:hypothetical protein
MRAPGTLAVRRARLLHWRANRAGTPAGATTLELPEAWGCALQRAAADVRPLAGQRGYSNESNREAELAHLRLMGGL